MQTGRNNFAVSGAFTLIELLVVLALIGTICALAAPTLARFTRGRTQDSEVRRFLGLTHYGQSRAVSEGAPMLLWIDPRMGAYGLEREAGYTEGDDTNAVQYQLAPDLRIDVMKAVNAAHPAHTKQNQLAIRFMPDGGVDSASVAGVTIQEGNERPAVIAKSASGFAYEIKN